MQTMALTPEMRDLLLPLWAIEMVESHTPTENTFGLTCDERGCAICNIGYPQDFLDHVRHVDALPDDVELLDAVAALVERLAAS